MRLSNRVVFGAVALRRGGVGLLGAVVAYSWMLMLAYMAHWISRGGPLF